MTIASVRPAPGLTGVGTGLNSRAPPKPCPGPPVGRGWLPRSRAHAARARATARDHGRARVPSTASRARGAPPRSSPCAIARHASGAGRRPTRQECPSPAVRHVGIELDTHAISGDDRRNRTPRREIATRAAGTPARRVGLAAVLDDATNLAVSVIAMSRGPIRSSHGPRAACGSSSREAHVPEPDLRGTA